MRESPRMPRMTASIFFQISSLRQALLPSNYFRHYDKHQNLEQDLPRNSRHKRVWSIVWCSLLRWCVMAACGMHLRHSFWYEQIRYACMYVVCTSAWYKQIVCTKHQPLCAMHRAPDTPLIQADRMHLRPNKRRRQGVSSRPDFQTCRHFVGRKILFNQVVRKLSKAMSVLYTCKNM